VLGLLLRPLLGLGGEGVQVLLRRAALVQGAGLAPAPRDRDGSAAGWLRRRQEERTAQIAAQEEQQHRSRSAQGERSQRRTLRTKGYDARLLAVAFLPWLDGRRRGPGRLRQQRFQTLTAALHDVPVFQGRILQVVLVASALDEDLLLQVQQESRLRQQFAK